MVRIAVIMAADAAAGAGSGLENSSGWATDFPTTPEFQSASPHMPVTRTVILTLNVVITEKNASINGRFAPERIAASFVR